MLGDWDSHSASGRSDALPVSECWWLYVHLRWRPEIFPGGLTVHCTDRAGHCLIFFIVIISLSDWPSSLVSARVRCYQLTWSVWSVWTVLLLLLVLQISSSHFTEHQSFTESFVLPRAGQGQREGRNVKGIQCVMFALCEPSQSLGLITPN